MDGVETGPESPPLLAPEDLTPRQIVEELDRHVVGQAAAKRAVAIALRNRIRRRRLPPELREDIHPKNIIMIGPTGVGKTEIARRLARLTRSPFLKVEASKFTEVGYVGRDAESMVRDLTELSVQMVRDEHMAEVEPKAREAVEEKLLDLLMPRGHKLDFIEPTAEGREEAMRATREKLREQLRAGKLDGRRVEVDVQERMLSAMQIFTPGGMEELDVNLREMLPGLFGGGRARRKKVKVAEAKRILLREEAQKRIDSDSVASAAVKRVEEQGIIFLDEIDKVAGRESAGRGPDVSREGVQRDLLPIVEGTTVITKHGMVKTDHILFIAAGAFHVAKPADLIPELQGRFPIRVELSSLGQEDFVRILTEPQNALLKQAAALLGTEGVDLRFEEGAVRLIAEYAVLANEQTENIGARRLHTVLERLLDEISFEAADGEARRLTIDEDYVRRMVAGVVQDPNLSRYIL